MSIFIQIKNPSLEIEDNYVKVGSEAKAKISTLCMASRVCVGRRWVNICSRQKIVKVWRPPASHLNLRKVRMRPLASL